MLYMRKLPALPRDMQSTLQGRANGEWLRWRWPASSASTARVCDSVNDRHKLTGSDRFSPARAHGAKNLHACLRPEAKLSGVGTVCACIWCHAEGQLSTGLSNGSRTLTSVESVVSHSVPTCWQTLEEGKLTAATAAAPLAGSRGPAVADCGLSEICGVPCRSLRPGPPRLASPGKLFRFRLHSVAASQLRHTMGICKTAQTLRMMPPAAKGRIGWSNRAGRNPIDTRVGAPCC